MKYPWSDLHGFPKMLVICVAILLVSAGLCGLQLAISSAASSSSLTGILMIPGILELIAFWGSTLGIVIAAIGWIISLIYHGITSGKSETHHQVDSPDDENQSR